MREAPSPAAIHQAAPYQTVADIIAERDALRKDAKRWRWLRQQGGWPDSEAAMMNATPEDFDTMADARIGAA